MLNQSTMTSSLLVVFALACLQGLSAQQPCDSLDPGPFLATKPTLNMRVYEATQTDLDMYPNSEKYMDELRLSGNIGDTGASGISLEVMEDFRLIDPRDVFKFETEAVTGKNYLKLVKAVDRDGPSAALDDDINLFTFTLKCVPAFNTSIQVFYDVRIQVMDVNDNFPTFVGAPYNITTINELSPVGTLVTKVSAVDIDFPLLSNITYSIVPASVDDGSQVFSINSLTGEITVRDMLDYESLSQDHAYNLEVMATDSDIDAPKSAKTTLKVALTDGDDQGPVFEYQGCFRHKGTCAWPKYTTYANQMKQGEPITVYPVPNKVGHPVIIKARDLDASMSEVKFSIASTIPPGFESHFEVTTSHSNGAFYTAAVKQITPLTVTEGFEIFLKVEELSGHKRYDMSMIYFLGHNKGSTTDKPSDKPTDKPEDKPTDGPEKSPVTSGTPQDTLALIIVVAILAAFMLCLAVAFICFVMRRGSSSGHKYQPESNTRGPRNGLSMTHM